MAGLQRRFAAGRLLVPLPAAERPEVRQLPGVQRRHLISAGGLTGCFGLAQAQRAMGCFACSAVTELAAGERIGFRDTCSAFDADLHVCLNCVHYDPGAYNRCRESSAEWVSDRERANRCEYFVFGEPAEHSTSAESETARDALVGLFKKP